MNIESVREYCLSLPLVAEAFPFDEQTLVFRILGKIFACVDPVSYTHLTLPTIA